MNRIIKIIILFLFTLFSISLFVVVLLYTHNPSESFFSTAKIQLVLLMKYSLPFVDTYYRKYFPPNEDQIRSMQENSKLCYANDDCRNNSLAITDCNFNPRNKYYHCETGDFTCFNTAMGCKKNYLLICKDNQCQKEYLYK